MFDDERDVEFLNLIRGDRDFFRFEDGEALGENLDIIRAGREIFYFVNAVAIGGDGDELAASRSDEHRCAGHGAARRIGYLAAQGSGGACENEGTGENGDRPEKVSATKKQRGPVRNLIPSPEIKSE